MKSVFLNLFFTLMLAVPDYAQNGNWVWMNGSNVPGALPVYGVRGQADINNTPGALYEASNWIDSAGNFWIFGGVPLEVAANSSDLWKYDPSNNTWTWVKGPGQYGQPGIYGLKGVSAPSNNPGGRGWGSAAWTDKNGDFWLFGGDGLDLSGHTGILNDLWKYHIASNEWTWMSGSSGANGLENYGSFQQFSDTTAPGGRQENNSAWTDNNNYLWFFGGNGEVPEGGGMFTQINFNDMWCYSIANNQWAWMSGPKDGSNNGSYGIKGVESSSNLPSPRVSYTRWQDEAGYFYIWGGAGNGANLSDVWRYNLSTHNWTWVAGDSTMNSHGKYAVHCTANEGEGPFSRFENKTAPKLRDTHIFPSFGGQIATSLGSGEANDLWYFNSETNQWRWLSGDSTRNSNGNYGSVGVPAISNVPSARSGNCIWVDKEDAIWIFGGVNSSTVALNDLWKFIPDKSCTPCDYCDSTISVNVEGIENIKAQLYPNPNNGSFIITFSDNVIRTLQITDALGRVIMDDENVSGTKEFILNSLAGGVYFTRIKQQEVIKTIRFVVVR